MVKVVVVNGKPGCGKTTFQNLCRDLTLLKDHIPGWQPEHDLWTACISSIDPVKEVAAKMGWDGTKTLKNRKLLSDLKRILTEWGDYPHKELLKSINYAAMVESQDWLIFVDSREPEDIQWLKDTFNATTILIRRPGDEDTETSNSSDADVFNYNYDLTISNDSDIIVLKELAKTFIEYMRGRPHYEYDY